MKLLKIVAGFSALIHTLVGMSLLFGPFIPSMSGNEPSLFQHFSFAIFGALATFCAVRIWIWSLKDSEPKQLAVLLRKKS
jgi:hypothetical protein